MATEVNAPMVGEILRVEASVGANVEEDETIIVMEAMKMEIKIVAPESGVLSEIRVAAGDAVGGLAPLGHAEIGDLGLGKHELFDECTRIKERLETLAGGELALGMLTLGGARISAEDPLLDGAQLRFELLAWYHGVFPLFI